MMDFEAISAEMSHSLLLIRARDALQPAHDAVDETASEAIEFSIMTRLRTLSSYLEAAGFSPRYDVSAMRRDQRRQRRATVAVGQ